jgi:acyl-CoA dehydrogenase
LKKQYGVNQYSRKGAHLIGFEASDVQKAIQRVAHEFAEKEIRPIAADFDEEKKYPEHFIGIALNAGMTCLHVPEDHIGQGMDFLTACIVGEELAWGCCGIDTNLGANNLGVTPLLLDDSEEQTGRYLHDLTSRSSSGGHGPHRARGVLGR